MTIAYTAPVTTLLNAVNATGYSDTCRPGQLKRTFQATASSANSAFAVTIEGSNDGVGWVPIVELAGAGNDAAQASVGYTTDAPWRDVRANVTTLTDGTITVTMGT